MATTSTIYVVMSANQAAAELRELVDNGRWGDANKLSYELKAFYDHVKAFAQQRGGHLYLHLYERSVLDLPITAAEEFPQVVDEFVARFGTRIAVGMGFSQSEAAEAAEKSARTGEIELYGESDGKEEEDEGKDYEGEGMPYELPPNLTDPLNPPAPPPAANAPHEPPPPGIMSPEEEMQGQQALMQAMLGGAPQQSQPPPQQAPQGQPQQEQGGEPARRPGLLESLGHKPKGAALRQQAGEEASAKQGHKPEKEEKAEPEASGEGEATSGAQDKVMSRLAFIRGSLPEMIGLAERNPKAFNHIIGVVKKLVSLAKSMGVTGYEELTKEMDAASRGFRGKYPVGTTIRGKKKVLVDGKARWRGVRSGLVKDPKGQAVSVISSNAQATEGKE